MSAVRKAEASRAPEAANDDLVRESKAARVRQLMSEGLSLDDIAREAGLSEAEIRELMDEGRIIP